MLPSIRNSQLLLQSNKGYQSLHHQNTKTNAAPTRPNAVHEKPLLTTEEDSSAPPFTVPVPFTGAVVAPVKITSVVPEITVVFPFSGTSESMGTVVGPENTSNSDPDITVIRPGYVFVDVGLGVEDSEEDKGIVIPAVNTNTAVPLIVDVEPCRPAGAPESGIVVGEGYIRNDIPPNSVVLGPPASLERAIVVADGIIKNGEPFINVVLPLNPVGASDNGIVVAPGIMMKGVPDIIVVLAP